MTTPRDAIAGQETHTVHDPFLKKDVEVSSKLTDRLRGKYASGPTTPNGEPEFGWRQFETPPIQHEAAGTIDALQARVKELEEENGILRDMLLNPDPDIEPDNLRLHREKCDAIDRALVAESRALRAEQERDEAYKRAAKVAFARAARWKDAMEHEDSPCGMSLYDECLDIGAIILRLSACPEKEGK